MKKLLTMMLALGSLAVFVGCGGDDDKPTPFTIDGETYNVLNAYVVDLNYQNGFRQEGVSGPVSGKFFYITNGEVTFNEEFGYRNGCEGCTFYAEMYLYSQADAPENGEYSILNYCSSYTYDNTIEFYASSDDELSVNSYSGTVAYSQNGDRYTFTFDGMLLDWNDYTGPTRTDGCNTDYYGKVEVEGTLKMDFISVDENLWWD